MNYNEKINNFKEKFKKEYDANCGIMKVADITFYPELRQPCESNVCGNYGKNHMCPPLVGTPEEVIAKARKYNEAIIFQHVYELEDSYDFEGMESGKREFEKLFLKISADAEKIFDNPLCLSAGGCMICERCTAYDSLPCRFPDKARASLESYCIQVSEVSEACGMKYINGVNTVTYFGGIFVR